MTSKYGLSGSISDYGKGATIVLDADSTERLFRIVAPYVLPCLHYKVPERYRVEKSFLEQIAPFSEREMGLVECDVLEVGECELDSLKQSTGSYVYDLTVEDTHTYFVQGGILVHNSNILAYGYTDGRKTFVTYKTRLQPLLKASRWGDWGALWRVMLQKYPDIPTLPERNNAAVSFELYGSMNPHLVAYDVALDVKVLFGVTVKGEIVPVSALDTGSVAPAKLEAEVRNQSELRATYERLREKMTALNRANAHTGKFVTEGMVLYCHTLEGKVIPYKLKPEEIEEIHWAAGQGISKSIVQQACWKALENGYDLSVDSVRCILEEDWEPRQVDVVTAAGFVNDVITDIERQVAFKAEVLERYRALGVSLRENKSAVMRALSPHFNKSDMQKVYAIIAIEEGLA